MVDLPIQMPPYKLPSKLARRFRDTIKERRTTQVRAYQQALHSWCENALSNTPASPAPFCPEGKRLVPSFLMEEAHFKKLELAAGSSSWEAIMGKVVRDWMKDPKNPHGLGREVAKSQAAVAAVPVVAAAPASFKHGKTDKEEKAYNVRKASEFHFKRRLSPLVDTFLWEGHPSCLEPWLLLGRVEVLPDDWENTKARAARSQAAYEKWLSEGKPDLLARYGFKPEEKEDFA